MNQTRSIVFDENEKYVRDGFWKKIRAIAQVFPFAKDAIELYFCAIDPKTPLGAKVIAFSALAYLILPLDLIPDIIPVGGYADDVAAIIAAVGSLQIHITDEHRKKAADCLNR